MSHSAVKAIQDISEVVSSFTSSLTSVNHDQDDDDSSLTSNNYLQEKRCKLIYLYDDFYFILASAAKDTEYNSGKLDTEVPLADNIVVNVTQRVSVDTKMIKLYRRMMGYAKLRLSMKLYLRLMVSGLYR